MVLGDPARKGYYFIVCALPFFLPFPLITSAVCTGLLAVMWLPATNVKLIPATLKASGPLLFWLLFYLLHVASYFYSPNKEGALFDLQRKLSFIVLPVVIATGATIRRRWLERILLAFIAGLCIVAIACLIGAAIDSLQGAGTRVFFYHTLVSWPFTGVNAVEMAWYVITALAALLLYPWEYTGRSFRIFINIASFILIFFFVLLSSRLLLVLFSFLVLPLYAYQMVRAKRISRLAVAVLCITAILLIGFIALTKNPVSRRYSDVLHPTQQPVTISQEGKKTLHFTNGTLRLFLWQMALDNVKEHNLWAKGCGYGDVERLQTAQVKNRERRGYDFTYNQNLGSFDLHNMYLQSLMMLGLPGLLVFCCIVFAPLFYLRKVVGSGFWLCFHVISALFFMQESALHTQAGVIFYCFFSALFWHLVKRGGNKKAISNPIT